MKIAFFWTWDFSKNTLKWILENKDIEIWLVVSQPDKPIWRKKIITITPVKEIALENNIKVLQPEKLKNNTNFFKELEWFDFIVVVAYWKIVPKEVLDAPKYWCINIHGSILPKYRWASPIQEAIKNWDTETWLTIMFMSEAMDEWDILDIEKVKIDNLDTTEDIFKKFEKIGSKLLIKTLKWVIKWEIKWKKQNDSEATYCSKISKEDWEINFKKDSAKDIYNKYRAYHNWPWIYTYFNGKKLNLEKIELIENNKEWKIWDIIKIDKKNIWVITSDNKMILLKQVKLEWKKSMGILSFINWNKDFLDYKF
jgi:methionyl-tRNA formyltransferase